VAPTAVIMLFESKDSEQQSSFDFLGLAEYRDAMT
jgi:hypothetical protein